MAHWVGHVSIETGDILDVNQSGGLTWIGSGPGGPAIFAPLSGFIALRDACDKAISMIERKPEEANDAHADS